MTCYLETMEAVMEGDCVSTSNISRTVAARLSTLSSTGGGRVPVPFLLMEEPP